MAPRTQAYQRAESEHTFHQTENHPGVRGFIIRTEDGQFTFYDGIGNKTALIDTTGGNVAWSLLEPKAALGLTQIVKRTTAGANTLTVSSPTGNIDGSASHSIPTQYMSFTYVSDGTNYWIV